MKPEKNNIPSIGHYLKRHVSEASVTEQALKVQEDLRAQGIYKPVGQIMEETGSIERPLLEQCLAEQRVDVLSRVNLFASLPQADLIELSSVLKNVILPQDETVVSIGEPGDTFYVVAAGSVTISREESGLNVVVDDRGPGEGFGEIALLTGKPHTTTVITRERTSLILIPRETFLRTVFSHPDTARTCATILAERLERGYTQIVDRSVDGEGYRQFISETVGKDELPLIGNSPVILNLLQQIDRLAGNTRPVLVQGEPGTETRSVAGIIHMMLEESSALLLEMDAKSLAHALNNSEGNDTLSVELIQSGTLYGRGLRALPFAPDRSPGLLTLAGSGIVVIENIEHLTRRVQQSIVNMIEKGWYTAVGEHQPLPAAARIVATSSVDLQERVRNGAFDQRLYDILSAQTIAIPPLRQRKQDLRMITGELIKQSSQALGKSLRSITEEAYQSLMAYDWPGNTEELAMVLRRAVSVSQSETLTPEELFIGQPSVTGKITLNLLRWDAVQRFLTSRLYPTAALAVTVPFIAFVIVYGLIGPRSPEHNVVPAIIWGLWEPMLLAGTFIVSRGWCAICPLGVMSRPVSRSIGLNLKVPPFLRNNGFYIAGGSIAVIFWAEAASGMVHSPRATAILVLTLVCLAALFGFLFQRRTWCRYVCGLGGMAGVLSTCSVLELRSNAGVCNSSCKDHECYIGTGRDEGCPLFQGPFSLASNMNCVLCGACVKTCPHQSPVLNLRIPAYDLWSQRVPDKAVAVIALFLMGSQFFRGIGNHGFFGYGNEGTAVMWAGTFVLMCCCVLLAALYAKNAGELVFPKSDGTSDLGMQRFIYAVIPLIFSFEIAYQLKRLVAMARQVLPALGHQFGITITVPFGTISPFTLQLLQILLLSAGAAGSLAVLAKQRIFSSGDTQILEPCRLWPVYLLFAVYLAAFLGVRN